MRLKMEFIGDDNIVLPRGYNEYMQAIIYSHLNEKEAQWLHDKGFAFEKRKFKFFVFSDILEKGRYDKSKKVFIYKHNVSFFVSSPVDWILEQLAKNIISSEFVMMGKNKLRVGSVSIIKTPDIKSTSVKVRSLSPVEVHSTFNRHNGSKQTHYYTPFENQFNELVNSNIQKKWKAFYNLECPHSLSLKPLFNGNKFEKIRFFGTGPNKTVIKGWKGYFRLQGDPELLAFAVDAGLGSRNSSGFGLVEVVG